MTNPHILRKAYKEVHNLDIEQLLRTHYPGRNEKYYQILLLSKEKLINESYKLELTADAIIKGSNSARPTWYTYFKSVDDYYAETLDVIGKVMLDHTMNKLSSSQNFEDWTSKIGELRMEVFLSNIKSLACYFPKLLPHWQSYYDKVIDGYTAFLQPMLKLSLGRAKLLVRNMVNEMILHAEKYYKNPGLYSQYVKIELQLAQAEQNK
jgi:hypothetical protein